MIDVQGYAISLAIETGKILLQYFNLTGIRADPKPDQTVVTEADIAADQYISQRIVEDYPSDGIISEESSHFLCDSCAVTWVIDPLDGTTNFSLGLPVWGVSIARLVNGFPELGVIYFPILQELYVSRKGSGAWLNDQPIQTRAPNPVEPMSFFACCSRTFRTFDVKIPYKARIMGSSAYTFCMVARGAALLGFDSTPKVWDLAAAWLLVEEAGGIIQPFEIGKIFPLSSGLDYSTTSYSVLAAANGNLLNMGLKKITRKTE